MEEFTQAKFSAQLDSKGRITIPARIRDRLGLEKGDKVLLELDSSKVLRKEFSSKKEALNFLSQLQNVESFSFDSGTLEVITNE